MKYTDDGKEIGASKIGTIMLGWGPFDGPDVLRINAQHRQAGVEVLDQNRWAEAAERGNELEIPLGEWAVKKIQRLAPDVEIIATRPSKGFFWGTPALDRIGASLDFLLHIDGELFIPDHKGDLLRIEGEGPLEVKTTGYHEGEPTLHHQLQGHAQCLCGGWDWFIIAQLGKGLKFELFPYRFSPEIGEQMVIKATDFWRRVAEDDPYPELAKELVEQVDLGQLKTNEDIADLCDLYLAATEETKKWKASADEIKNGLIDLMERADAEVGVVDKYKIEWKRVKKKGAPARQVEATPASEYRRFAVKEIKQ
tara:strand:- start:497 stop:1426 length:930 start_codon:yes stop_codon:yes gene_type:complete